MKLFGEIGNEEVAVVDYTNLDNTLYSGTPAESYDSDLAVEALEDSYAAHIRLTGNDDTIDDSVLAIESMGDLSNESTPAEIRAQYTQLLLLGNDLGDTELVQSLEGMTGDLSAEAIVAKKKGLLEGLKRIKDTVGKNLADNLKEMVTLRQNLKKYNVDKLKTQLARVNSGELVPKDSVDPKAAAKFNEKLAMMKIYGYSPAKGGKEIATYLDKRLSEVTKDGIFEHVFHNVIEEFKKFFKTKKIEKDSKSSKMIASLKVDFSVKPDSDDFKAGVMTRVFGGSGRLISVVQPAGKGPTVHMDTIAIDTSKMDLIKSVKKDDGVALLEYAISAYSDIAKALPILESSTDNKTDFKLILKAQFSINAGLLIKQLTNATVLTAKDLMSYQNIALDYINLTFESKK